MISHVLSSSAMAHVHVSALLAIRCWLHAMRWVHAGAVHMLSRSSTESYDCRSAISDSTWRISLQGCAEIRWLAEKMGAKPATVSGLSGLGDIMLTCYGALSRNRSVGIRLGQGEALDDILASSTQVRPWHSATLRFRSIAMLIVMTTVWGFVK